MDRGFQEDFYKYIDENQTHDYRVKKELTIEMFQQMFAHKSLWTLWPQLNIIGALLPNNHSPTKSVHRS
jgi:hypothetical protein